MNDWYSPGNLEVAYPPYYYAYATGAVTQGGGVVNNVKITTSPTNPDGLPPDAFGLTHTSQAYNGFPSQLYLDSSGSQIGDLSGLNDGSKPTVYSLLRFREF